MEDMDGELIRPATNDEPGRQADASDGITRRAFLEILGSSFAVLAMGGCKLRPPEEKIVPYLTQPEETVSGNSLWYASTCGSCPSACGALVKVRDGRPIKLEGNPEHPLSRGGLCARGQASVLDLYDSLRLKKPQASGKDSTWAAVDGEIQAALAKSKSIRIVSRTVNSPSLDAALSVFRQRYPSAQHVSYDPSSSWAIAEAHRRTHGKAAVPHYRFGQARVIVSFDADFLGTWLSPVEFARDWSANRRPEGEAMSWHAQFEPRMSVTGANADLRAAYKPSQEFATVATLGRMVAKRTGWSGPLPADGVPGVDYAALEEAADKLAGARKRSLVVSGSKDPGVQMLVNWLNAMLGGYGETVDLSRPSYQAKGEDPALEALIAEMSRGAVDALIVLDANPAYDQPRAKEFAGALSKVKTTVAIADRADETAALCRYVCPLSHPLESFADAHPTAEVYSLFQPTVAPLFDSRPGIEVFLAWAGKTEKAYDFIKEQWRVSVFPKAKDANSFGAFWESAVQRGAVTVDAHAEPAASFASASLSGLKSSRQESKGDFELAAYAGVALADGRHANNPWLQELPDPVTRVSWGNVASFAPQDAKRLGLEEGRVVRLTAGKVTVELPAHIQLGQAEGTIASALGYGRKDAGAIAGNYPMVKLLPVEKDLLAGADLYPFLLAGAVTVERTGRVSELAKIQIFDSLTDPLLGQKREIVQETTLAEYKDDPRSGNPEGEEDKSLWPRHEYKGQKWGLAIDLNACTGCAACVVACQAENNIPVVGKAEIRKGRDMYWLRIDRYYGEPIEPAKGAIVAASRLSVGAGSPAHRTQAPSPSVAFQPMLCQHCDNAPCETVCPVLATVHSSEGLNMQVYNRCVGTRYCANNCPYKVRRFNWFDYAHQDLLQNLALNPDVSVRTRGVMEKCSMCVQRIYSAKFTAAQDGRELKDGEATPACAQSCPAQAILFGDLNDPKSRIAKAAKGPRAYRVLAELGVGPSVFYETKVRNTGA